MAELKAGLIEANKRKLDTIAKAAESPKLSVAGKSDRRSRMNYSALSCSKSRDIPTFSRIST